MCRRCSSTAPAAARTTTPAASSISMSWSTTIVRPTARCCRRSLTGCWPRTSTISKHRSPAAPCARSTRSCPSTSSNAARRAGFIHTCGAGSRSRADCCTPRTRSSASVWFAHLAQRLRHSPRRRCPGCPTEFDTAAFWTNGLLLTYAAELRSERPSKIRALHADATAELDALVRALVRQQGWTMSPTGRYRNPSTRGARWSSACAWAGRRVQGKALSVLRLLKASLTFDGGLSYLAWKIERHSGVKTEITPFMRRFPRLGAIGALWRTWRRGGFH